MPISSYYINIKLTIASNGPVWDDFRTNLVIKASFLRDDELKASTTLAGFTQAWGPAMVSARSVVIPGPEPGGTQLFRPSTASPQDIWMPISQADFESLKLGDGKSDFSTLFVWASPDGAAALTEKGETYKNGLLKAYGQEKPVQTKNFGSHTIQYVSFEIEVYKSSISYMIDHIERYNHGNNAAVENIKDLYDRNERYLAPAQKMIPALQDAYDLGNTQQTALAQFGVMSVPRGRQDYVQFKSVGSGDPFWETGVTSEIERTFNPLKVDDIPSGFVRKNFGRLDLKPELDGSIYDGNERQHPGLPAQNYGSFITIGNNGKIYRADVLSNMAWGYTGGYIGIDADTLNGLANLDPDSRFAPQDDISTIIGTHMEYGNFPPSINGGFRADLFEYILNKLQNEPRLSAEWIGAIEQNQRTNPDAANVSLQEYFNGEEY